MVHTSDRTTTLTMGRNILGHEMQDSKIKSNDIGGIPEDKLDLENHMV